MRRKILGILITLIIAYVFLLTTDIESFGKPIFNYLIENGFNETSSENLVTSVYLYYRYYDTIFEALLLIISVIAIIYLSIHKEHYHE